MLLDAFRAHDTPPFDILHFHDWHMVEAMHVLRDRNTVLSYHSTGNAQRRNSVAGEVPEISGKRMVCRLHRKSGHNGIKLDKDRVMWLYGVRWKVTVIPGGSTDTHRIRSTRAS